MVLEREHQKYRVLILKKSHSKSNFKQSTRNFILTLLFCCSSEIMGLPLINELGRFAEWEYYNMDVAMGAALDLVKELRF